MRLLGGGPERPKTKEPRDLLAVPYVVFAISLDQPGLFNKRRHREPDAHDKAGDGSESCR